MRERIGPKLVWEAGSVKHSTDPISNNAVRPFHSANFTGGVWAGDFDLVASLAEQFLDICRASKFTTAVESNRAMAGACTVVGNPMAEEIKWRTFVLVDRYLPGSTLAVGDENIAYLTI